MKNYILVIVLFWMKSNYSYGQVIENQVQELENFIVQTDQDLYLSGDRIWFGAKLLKNHNSFRYSKLAYISVVDHQGQEVYREKMLLSGKDMVFGDLFLSENSPSGVYSLLIYTSWMTSFKNFPVAKKSFLVFNPKLPQVSGEPALFFEQNASLNSSISILHTSSEPELLELQDSSGKTIQVIEQVPGLKKVFLKVPEKKNLSLIFRNKRYSVPKSDWLWEPASYSLKKDDGVSEGKYLIVHNDWKIFEKIELTNGNYPINKSLTEDQETFKLTVLNDQFKAVWTYQVKNPDFQQKGKVTIPSNIVVNQPLEVEFSGYHYKTEQGFIMVKEKEDEQISDWVDIINHPNWIQLNSTTNQTITTISNLQHHGNDSIHLKDFSPMLGYKPIQLNPKIYFPEVTAEKSYSFQLPSDIIEEITKRKIYQTHFEIRDEVVELTSPFAPDEVFFLQDYYEFESFENFAKEILFPLKIRESKTEAKKELWVANTDDSRIKFNKKPLVLIDFYRIQDLEELLSLDMNTLYKIEIYYHRATVQQTNLGEEVGDGLVLVYTKNNGYALKNNIPNSRKFLQDVGVPRSPISQSQQLNPTSNSLQTMFPELMFTKGKSKTPLFMLDTAGDWMFEALIFEQDNFYQIKKQISVNLQTSETKTVTTN